MSSFYVLFYMFFTFQKISIPTARCVLSSNPTLMLICGEKYALWKSGAYNSCIRFYFKNLFQCWGNPYPSSPNVFVDALYDSISPQWHAAHHQPVLMKQLICEPQIRPDELLLALLHAICAKRSIQKRYLLDNSHFLHIYDMLNIFCNVSIFKPALLVWDEEMFLEAWRRFIRLISWFQTLF